MDETFIKKTIETLSHSSNVQEIQEALMQFSLRVEANSCPQPLRLQLWQAMAANARIWRLFTEEKDVTLPQIAAHVMASFAGDDVLRQWGPIGDILVRLTSRLKDVPDENSAALESFSKDLLIICLTCSRVVGLTTPVAQSLLFISKCLSKPNLTSLPDFYQYFCDCMRNLSLAEKWYRDGTVRSVFTWIVNIGLEVFIKDQSAAKFEIARLVGGTLLNAAPPTSSKHRVCVLDTFLPEKLRIPLADSVRTVLLSKSLSHRHISAIIVLNAGLQRWLSRQAGDIWLFTYGSSIFPNREELDKLLPLLAVHCSTEFARIISRSSLDLEEDQTIAAALELLEDLLEFVVLRSDENDQAGKALSSSILLETHRCLREAGVSAINHLIDAEFEQPNDSSIYSEAGSLKLASFRWACRFVAQDAASMEPDQLSAFVRYGADGLTQISLPTCGLIPMFVAALGNILSLGDSEKYKSMIKQCFIDNGEPRFSSLSGATTYADHVLHLTNGIWQQKAVEVGSEEGNELLDGLRQSLENLKTSL